MTKFADGNTSLRATMIARKASVIVVAVLFFVALLLFFASPSHSEESSPEGAVGIGGSVCVVDGIICAPQEFSVIALSYGTSVVISHTGLYGAFWVDGIPVGVAELRAWDEEGGELVCNPSVVSINPTNNRFNLMCFPLRRYRVFLPVVSN